MNVIIKLALINFNFKHEFQHPKFLYLNLHVYLGVRFVIFNGHHGVVETRHQASISPSRAQKILQQILDEDDSASNFNFDLT